MADYYNFVLCLVVSFFNVISAAPHKGTPYAINIPDECKGQHLCSIKPHGYERLESIINQVLPKELLQEYDDREGPETREPELSPQKDWHNCPQLTEYETVYLHTKNNETDIIVQTKLFRQEFERVSCAMQHINTTSEEQCFGGLHLNEFGMSTTCETIEAHRTLYVWDPDKHKIITKAIPMPVGCTCKIRNKD